MNIQTSSNDENEINSSFDKTTLEYSEFNNKRFHITIINHNVSNLNKTFKVGNRPHKKFNIYRETSEDGSDSVSKDKKQLHHKIFQIQRNSVKNDQEDLIIFD